MFRYRLAFVSLLLIAGAAQAQKPGTAPAASGAACPRGTTYAMIRHSVVKAGQWTGFEGAVAAHNAWYAGKHSGTVTKIVRVVDQRGARPGLSGSEAVTVTRYVGPQPQRDAGYAAFTAKYKASATIRDEARVCLPAL
jgi:hypothetical protein